MSAAPASSPCRAAARRCNRGLRRRAARPGARPSPGRRQSRSLDRAGDPDRGRRRPARRSSGGLGHDGGRARVGGRGVVRPAGAVRPLRMALPRLPHRRRDLSPLSGGACCGDMPATRCRRSRWRGALRPTGWQGFLRALLLQLSNPKIMVFFGSIFLSLLPQNLPVWMDATVLAIVALNEFTWFALLALLFSGGPARALSTDGQNSGWTASWAAPWRCSVCASPWPAASGRRPALRPRRGWPAAWSARTAPGCDSTDATDLRSRDPPSRRRTSRPDGSSSRR